MQLLRHLQGRSRSLLSPLPSLSPWFANKSFQQHQQVHSVAKDNERWHYLPPVQKEAGSGFRDAAGEAPGTQVAALQWVRQCCPQLPISFLHKLFRKRQVRVVDQGRPVSSHQSAQEGCSSDIGQALKRVQSSSLLPAGAVVCLPGGVAMGREQKELCAPPLPSFAPSKTDIKLLQDSVLYKDEHIIVINKPSGLPTQGGHGIRRSVDSIMGAALSFNAPEGPRLVHRLDRETSGALVLGRTRESTAALHGMLRRGSQDAGRGPVGSLERLRVRLEELACPEVDPDFKKICVDARLAASRRTPSEGTLGPTPRIHRAYWALVHGVPSSSSGTIRASLAKVAGGGMRVVLEEQGEDALEAVTHYKTVATKGGLTWLELQLLTGRKHQIRVHCARVLRVPVVGDTRYHKTRDERLGRVEDHTSNEQNAVVDTNWEAQCDNPSSFEPTTCLTANNQALHLHCREVWVPTIKNTNLDRALKGTRSTNCGNGHMIHVVAPLPPHMAEAWEFLGFDKHMQSAS